MSTQKLQGQLDELKFDSSGIEEFLIARENSAYIPTYDRQYFEGGYMFYRLDLDSKDDGYSLSGFYAAKVIIPALPHGSYQGVDTALLEKDMQHIDWELAAVRPETFNEAIMDVFSRLEQLESSLDENAVKVAAMLRKYYILIEHRPELHTRQHYFPVAGDFSDFSASDAYHLFSDRAVLKFRRLPDDSKTLIPEWRQLENGVIKTYAEFDFRALLAGCGIVQWQWERDGASLLYQLMRGQRVTVELVLADGELKQAGIEIDPASRGLRYYDQHGRQFLWQARGKKAVSLPETKHYPKKITRKKKYTGLR